MSTLNGQNNQHDQELLHAIEQIVQQEVHTPHDPHSPLGVGARLGATMPQPDAPFADRLEARLVAAAAPHKEIAMKTIAKQRPSTDRRVGTSSKRRAPLAILRIAAVCSAALVLLVGLVAAASPVRAAVENFIERFGLVGIDPDAPTPEPAEGVVGEMQLVVPQQLSLEEAQQQVPFPIQLPTWLPEGLQLQGVVVGEGGWGCNTPEECANMKPPVAVHVLYRVQPDAEANVALDITEITPQSGGGYGVSNSAIEEVRVNDQPAVYAKGGWEQKQAGNAKDLQWVDTADNHMLSWEQDGRVYTLSSYELGLSRDDMIRIAESLR